MSRIRFASVRRALLVCAVASLAALMMWAPPIAARDKKKHCKEIEKAIQAGRTMDQIMAEFQVDAQHVMKCTQKKGKRRKEKKPPKAKPAHAPKGGHS